MSANIFDKVLKIIQIVVTILQFAIRSFLVLILKRMKGMGE